MPPDGSNGRREPAMVAAPIKVTRAHSVDARVANLKPNGRFSCYIVGASMTRAGIRDGDTVYFRRTREAKHGDLVLVRLPDVTAGLPLLKRLIITASGQKWAVSESHDPKFGALRLPRRAAIIGVAEAVRFNGCDDIWEVG
jgi:SOS-response transcriptional repressor LexA